MYPTIVVALIHFQYTMVDNYDFSVSSATGPQVPEQAAPGIKPVTDSPDTIPVTQSEERDGHRTRTAVTKCK